MVGVGIGVRGGFMDSVEAQSGQKLPSGAFGARGAWGLWRPWIPEAGTFDN